MKKLLTIFLIFLPLVAISQSGKMNVGLGMGIDYGGFGGRFTFLPTEKFGLFAAVGYNLDAAGYNGGALYKFNNEKKVRPYVIAMYGYNGVIRAKNADGTTDSKSYYGPSFGIGIELKTRNNENNFWNFELLFPLRPGEFSDDVDTLKDNGYDVTEPLPISISIGYHFGF